MTKPTIPAALRTHGPAEARTTIAVPLCRCETPIPSLWNGDCSLCRGAILGPDERPVLIAPPKPRILP